MNTRRRYTLPQSPSVPDFRAPWGVGLESDDLTRQIINQDGAHVATIGIDPLVDHTQLALAAPELLMSLALGAPYQPRRIGAQIEAGS